MKAISGIPASTLVWRRDDSHHPDFELRMDNEVVATLALQDETLSLARVETAEGSWTLKHLGLLAPVVTLRSAGAATNLAVFRPHALRHGKLQFQDGVTLDWVWIQESRPGGAFLAADGVPLVRLHPHVGRDLNAAPGL